ncbi:hypothetical protein PsorP6_012743 [Peronosclerospora sorghi]|uniref:Uncharacterized protein n=1 Tax=Peronosclerospora sorghi TaxID=230839 RepID=A0ACC0WG40_9STRA|nr:hypothetical protein PsorP6_012743 [Peronosclerospora sorghi]
MHEVCPDCVADLTAKKSQMVFSDHEPTSKHGSRMLRAHDGDEQVVAEERQGEFVHDLLLEIDEILERVQRERQTIEELEAIERAERAARVRRIKQLITQRYGQLFLEKRISIHALNSRNADQTWVREYRDFLVDRVNKILDLIVAKDRSLTPAQASQVREGNFEQMLAYRVPSASVRHLAFSNQYKQFLGREHSIANALSRNSHAEGSAGILPSSEVVNQELDRINEELDVPLFGTTEENEAGRL